MKTNLDKSIDTLVNSIDALATSESGYAKPRLHQALKDFAEEVIQDFVDKTNESLLKKALREMTYV
jgi:hypothetical protein